MPPSRTRPRNIILMVLDSLRHDGVGFSRDLRFRQRYDLYVERQTPTLDRLAQEGVIFTRAFSTAPYTTAAHAALFTSRYPSEHEVETMYPTRLAGGIPTLAGMLRDVGYATVHALDFETHFVESDLNRGAQHVVFHNDHRVLELLSRIGGGFYLFVHFGDIHAPYLRSFGETSTSRVYREAYAELRRRYGMPEIDTGYRQSRAQARVNSWPRERQIPRWVLDDFSALKTAMQLEGQYFRAIYPYYQQGINQFDQGRLARFVGELEQRGLLQDTLLVITSDHGEGPATDNQFGHGFDLSDGVLHVPLVLRYPGVLEPGREIDTPVSHLDVTPTVLELAGLEFEAHSFRGISLSGTLHGQVELPPDRGLYAENWRVQPPDPARDARPRRMLAHRALRTDRYKLVIQGRDLVGDELVLSLVDPALNLEQFVAAVNHRYMGLANTQPLEAWLKANQRRDAENGNDVLTDILALSRHTLGVDRYRFQHLRRLRSYLAERFHHYWHGGALDVPSLVRDVFEAYFLEFPSESIISKMSVLVQHHCRSVEDIMSLFQQTGPSPERYLLYDLEVDPFEEINLFSSGLTVAQERDALAMEIMLLEAFLHGRSPLVSQISPAPQTRITPHLQALG